MRCRVSARALAQGCAAILAIGLGAPAWGHGVTERVSVGLGGRQSNNDSFQVSISADGRFVAFGSYATNLVPGDTNGEGDVFVRDRWSSTTTRVSVGPHGAQGDAFSGVPSISADGRFIAFESDATNLAWGDTNGAADVFIRDRRVGTTRRVSLGRGVTQGDGGSGAPSISANGRFVGFISVATNLVPGDTNGAFDAFIRDCVIGTTRRVSLGPGGIQSDDNTFGPAISPGGRFVAFWSFATNLVPGDTNGEGDVFVRDRRSGATTRVSVGPVSAQGNGDSALPSISTGGRFVAFQSDATNLVPGDTNGVSDVFVHDRRTGATERVNVGPGGVQGNDGSGGASISADGRFVAFGSNATNLVPGDTNSSPDVFVHDRWTGKIQRVSVGRGGAQGNGYSYGGTISADGRFVAFESQATNLVPGDTNGWPDVFVHSLIP